MQQVEQESIIAAWLRVSIFKVYCNYFGDLLRYDPIIRTYRDPYHGTA